MRAQLHKELASCATLRTSMIQSLMPAGWQGSFKAQHPLPAWSSKAGEMDSESLDTPAQSLSVSGLVALAACTAHAVEGLGRVLEAARCVGVSAAPLVVPACVLPGCGASHTQT